MKVAIELTGIDILPSGRARLRKKVAGHKINATYANAELAARARDAILRKIADGEAEHVDGESIRSLGPRFLGSRNAHRATATDTSRWKHIARAPFATKPAALVTRREVLAWLDDLQQIDSTKREGRKFSRASRKHCLNLLRSFFKWALEREIVNSNPCIDVTIKAEDGDEDDGFQDDWYLDPDEQKIVLAAMPAGRDRRMLAVALGTGLRLNELLSLHLADVHASENESNPRIFVRYGTWDAGKQRYRPPKGRAGSKKTREVPLFGLALDAIREELADPPEENKYRLLFPSRWGGRRTKPPKSFLTLGVSIVRLKRAPWWHLLRHSCASSLVAGWWGKRWALGDVQMMMGHSSIKVTERYAHLIPSVVRETATEAQAAYLARPSVPRDALKRCHAAVMASKKLGAQPETLVLRSRRS